jgi:hypothetical protein
MKFILIVEGQTERKGVPDFIRKWLNEGGRLQTSVGVRAISLKGGGRDLFARIADKAISHLKGPRRQGIVGVIGLLDLYNPGFEWPKNCDSVDQRWQWGIEQIENKVSDDKFRMFFAVHEVEAWMLSEPSELHVTLSKADETAVKAPEKINFQTPPSKWLKQRYKHLKPACMKTTHGPEILGRLDPGITHDKCPYFGMMLDQMRVLARQAGL